MKPKVAFYWCAGCGGCEEAVVDLNENLLCVAGAVDFVFWPVALDFKRADVEALEDRSILAAFINGAVRSTEQEEMALLIRRKARYAVAFGSCAHLGGIPGLANLSNRQGIFQAVYRDTPSVANSEGVLPQTRFQDNGRTVHLPGIFDTVRKLDDIIDVDYYLPGCPPTPKLIEDAVGALLGGNLPPKGAVLAPDHALCSECPRRDSKPEKLSIDYKRPHQVLIDQEKCLMAQGLLCMGPATRGGCEARCINGNMPCTGCFGPTSRVRDFGAKALSGVASLAAGNEDDEILRALAGVPDPVGTFYRYSLPSGPIPRRKMAGGAAPQK